MQVLKKLVKKPQVDIALPLCALAIVLGALFGRTLPKEASLAVAICSSALVLLAQQSDPTVHASNGLQYVVGACVVGSLL